MEMGLLIMFFCMYVFSTVLLVQAYRGKLRRGITSCAWIGLCLLPILTGSEITGAWAVLALLQTMILICEANKTN